MILPSEQIMNQIDTMIVSNGILYREIAAELKVSEARVSQIFAEGSNITLKTVDNLHKAIREILYRRPPKIAVIAEEFLRTCS